MKEMRIPVDDNTSDLLKDAADRVGMKKRDFIKKQLERIAGSEYAKQQQEDARTS